MSLSLRQAIPYTLCENSRQLQPSPRKVMYTVSLSKTLRALANRSRIPEHEVGISDLHGWISQPASTKLEISPRRREAGCRQLLQRRKYPAKMAEPGAGFVTELRARGAPATCACGRANRSSCGARTPAGADASPRRVSSRRLRQRTLEADSKRLGHENAAAPVVVSFPLRVSPRCELARGYLANGAVGGRCTSARSTTSPPVSRQASGYRHLREPTPVRLSSSPCTRRDTALLRVGSDDLRVGTAGAVKPKNAGTDVIERGDFWGRSVAPRLADWAGRPPGRRRVPTCAAAGAHPHWERAG